MADGLLSIGAFSRASSLSVPTLRAYHDSGLLVPASVDPSTGYRSYSVDQLADALAIVRLRDLDVPLPLVHEILAARDPETTRRVLEQHESAMRERLAEAERIVAALEQGLPHSSTPAHRTSTRHVTTLECSASVPSEALWDWLVDSIGRLADVAANHMTTPAAVGALYTPAVLGDGFEEVTAFVAIEQPFLIDEPSAAGTELRIGEIPAREWATLTHIGGFDTIGDTYRILGAWVARNDDPDPDTAICELYPGILSDGDDAAIEIRWPLTQSEPPR